MKDIAKIAYDDQRNIALVTTDDGKTVTVDLYQGSEEPINICTSDRVGYCIHGKTSDGMPCRIDFDFGTTEQESLDLYDWRLESDDTKARLIIYA